MKIELPEEPYLLLTPGPLTTTGSVKETMLRDWCTWDRDYNDIVQEIRARLVSMASDGPWPGPRAGCGSGPRRPGLQS